MIELSKIPIFIEANDEQGLQHDALERIKKEIMLAVYRYMEAAEDIAFFKPEDNGICLYLALFKEAQEKLDAYTALIQDKLTFAGLLKETINPLDISAMEFSKSLLYQVLSSDKDSAAGKKLGKAFLKRLKEAGEGIPLPEEITLLVSTIQNVIEGETDETEKEREYPSPRMLNREDSASDNEEVQKALHAINQLVGAEELKAWIHELEAMRPYISQWSNGDDFPAQHLIFSIDPGNGTTHILEQLQKYLESSSLYNRRFDDMEDGLRFEELTFSFHNSQTMDMLQISNQFIEKMENYLNGLIAIHLEDWVDKLDSPWLRKLIQYCGRRRCECIFVFVVPRFEDRELSRIHRYIHDVLNVRILRFEPYTDDQLIKAAKNYLRKFDIVIDPKADQCIKHLLAMERSDQRFYGMKTIQKLCTGLLRLKIRNVAHDRNNCPGDILMEEDFNDILDTEVFTNKIVGYEQLDEMIGLSGIKNRVREIVLAMKTQKQMKEDGVIDVRPCYHMLFTGNPGTGKTQVARIIGKIFRENGLLPQGDLMEVNRMNMVGEYIGHTGPKTIALCRSAMGSILFVDEAYMLAAGSGNGGTGRDYGAEALGALIAEMENNRDKFIVILAGYEQEMEKLFRMNPGLRDRVPHKLHFDNYSRDELFLIFKSQLAGKYHFDDRFLESSEKFFHGLDERFILSSEFGNGRFVRNLVERIRMKALLRRNGEPLEKGKRLELLPIDLECAIADRDISGLNKKEKHRRIGFL